MSPLDSYDSNGNIITTTESVGAAQNSAAYTYDKLNRISSVARTKGADSYYEYDARGNRKANFEQVNWGRACFCTFLKRMLRSDMNRILSNQLNNK